MKFLILALLFCCCATAPVSIPEVSVAKQATVVDPKLLQLVPTIDELCARIEVQDEVKTRVRSLYVASVSRPNEMVVAIFEQEKKTFALVFIYQKGSWTILPEDFQEQSL